MDKPRKPVWKPIKTALPPIKKLWTLEELEMLSNHIVPPKRSMNAARNKACRLGIPFTPGDSDAEPSMLPEYNPQVSIWTDKEIDLLRKGKLPKGRSRQAAYEKAFRLGIAFNPERKKKTPQKERAMLLHDEIVVELKRTGNIRATANKFGLAYTTIRNIAKEIVAA